MIEPCPAGFFCPPFSGRPRPCPAGSFQPDLSAVREGQCEPCRAFWQDSGAGASACSISTNAILVICGVCGGLLLCCAAAALCRRRRRETLYGGQPGMPGTVTDGYFAEGGAGYGGCEMKEGNGDGGEPGEDEDGKAKRLTAEEKRQQLADRMLELEEEESAMMTTMKASSKKSKGGAGGWVASGVLGKVQRKSTATKTAFPDDDVEVMV